ncbi:hypothetical protein LINPERPRIM_LOCUS11163, partial [Linum perenne]
QFQEPISRIRQPVGGASPVAAGSINNERRIIFDGPPLRSPSYLSQARPLVKFAAAILTASSGWGKQTARTGNEGREVGEAFSCKLGTSALIMVATLTSKTTLFLLICV